MLWFAAALAQDAPLAVPVDESAVDASAVPAGAPEITAALGTTEIEVVTVGTAPANGTPFLSIGHRTDADGVGGAVGIFQALVVGADGGVAATTASARYGARTWAVGVHMPFASYRTSSGRTTGAGNLRLEGFRRFDSGGVVQLVGAEVHLPTGGAWTYANDAASLWPGGGVSAVYQRRQALGLADLILRGSLGVHGTRGVAPFPEIYVNASAVAAIDADLPVDGLGATAELALSVWDPSPMDVGGWIRWEATDGMRLRGGVLLPLGAWVGGSPGLKPGGVREATLSADLVVAL